MGAHGSQTDVTWLEGVFQSRRPSWILSNNFTVFWGEASRNSLQFKMILLEINNRVIEETLRAKFTGWDCTLCSILLVEVYKWSILANFQIYKAYAQLIFSFTQREVWVGGYNSGRCVCFFYIFLLNTVTDERNHKKITTEKPIIIIFKLRVEITFYLGFYRGNLHYPVFMEEAMSYSVNYS